MTSGKPIDRTGDTKLCPRCKEVKPFSEFTKDKQRIDGLATYCKPCNRKLGSEQREKPGARAKAAEVARQWRKDNPERARLHHLRVTYGVMPETYAAMLAAQNGRCAICDRPPNGRGGLHVDHDHKTGEIRGLLCHSCNVSIGHFQDDPTLIAKVVEYLIVGGAKKGA
jgi:Recombination endonuclease VII